MFHSFRNNQNGFTKNTNKCYIIIILNRFFNAVIDYSCRGVMVVGEGSRVRELETKTKVDIIIGIININITIVIYGNVNENTNDRSIILYNIYTYILLYSL